MRFLLDENFPLAAKSLLVGMGHEVHDTRLMGMRGQDDNQVIQVAQELQAVILTTDRDFFHTLSHSHPNHPGVIVVALRRPSRTNILERLTLFLSNVAEKNFQGRAFQLRDRTWVSFPAMSSTQRPQPPEERF